MDKDQEVDAHLEMCDIQLSNANNGKGVNSREKIHFIFSTIEKHGTRWNAWSLWMRELRKAGTLTATPAEAYASLIAQLKGIIPETPLELKIRKKIEFDQISQAPKMN